MQFHEYITLRTQLAKFGHDEAARKIGASMKPEQFRRTLLERVSVAMQNASPGEESNRLMERAVALAGEEAWANCDRPYYNVWPVAEELSRSVRLDLPFSQIHIPFDALLLRFARGYEPNKVSISMLFWPKNERECQNHVNVVSYFPGSMDRLTVRYDYEPTDLVDEWLNRTKTNAADSVRSKECYSLSHSNVELAPSMIRFVVLIGLLATDNDVITPVVLAADRSRYESANEEQVKDAIERRAVRRAGGGGSTLVENYRPEGQVDTLAKSALLSFLDRHGSQNTSNEVSKRWCSC